METAKIKPVAQLYARVFLQILESSIAEDFTVRHVFEDFLKLCDYSNGVVDITREAMSRRLNVPLKVLNDAIEKLEAPDSNSRDKDNEGRRIERLDEHRDWGWRIVNWDKYDSIRNRATAAMRVSRFRERKKGAERPSLKEVLAVADIIGLAHWKAEDWFNEMQGCGWLDYNKRSIADWRAVLSRVRTKWEADGRPSGPVSSKGKYDKNTNPRNVGVCRGPTDYGEAGKRKQAKQKLEREMAQARNTPPPDDGGA